MLAKMIVDIEKNRDQSANQLAKLVRAFGVVRLPGFCSGSELEPLNEEFEFLNSEKVPVGSGVEKIPMSAGFGAKLMLPKVPDTLGEIRRFYSENWMQEVSSAFFSGKPPLLNKEVYAMREVPHTEHVAQDLHFDVKPSLKFLLYLTDTTQENGAFSCVPGSTSYSTFTRLNAKKISYKNRHATRDHPFSEDMVVPVEGAAGTLIVFTSELWHRAGKVQSGERRALRGHNHYPNGGFKWTA
jgi:ectoine hydroxylase-related dioxygenase (phytanoyl-CoA dioxygenase family)